MIYANFESNLVLENNERQKPKESYMNKYQKHIASSYDYKLVCVDDNTKRCSLNFIDSIFEESKYCSNVMKKHFNKEFVMTKEDNESFKNYTKCWIYIDNDVKVRIIVISPKIIEAMHIEIIILFAKLNSKIPVVFHNLKAYDSHFIIQELSKFNLKINVIPNGLEKYMSYPISNK